ncbi:hypothetical protein [uncultured Parasutterella sp.]|uniref:hypothetical protein n=1 Tax=uncultured Parasutterella sp. TaxID=1263098 RepID=UPI002628BA13|nr:hypothetical protein [uncultured Parasutterella sp.]
MAKPSMPLADCLRPFNQSDRHKVQPLINELRQAVGDDHLQGIQTELFDVLVKIVGNFPLSSGSGYFWPGSYIDFSLKLSCIALNLLRQRIQFFTMPLAQKEFETQLLKLLVLTICFFFNLRITAMTFCMAAENGDEFRFEVPYEDWFKEHEGQELTLYHNVDPDPEAAAGNINRLVLKYLPESLQKRFAKSFKRGYLALLSKFIRGDVGSIVKDEFILILISQAESILREQMTTEFARQGEEPPHYIPSILSWAICALLANELSPEAALRKSDAIGNKEPLQIVARAITCKDGEIYAVIEYFFPLLTAKLQELFPRQTWREKEVLRMCCQCGIFDLKEGATFEEVANRIEIYKKCGKEVVSTPVQGLRFNNFLLYVANDSYFGRTVQSLQAKHSVNANDKKLKELGLYKPVAKWQWEDKKLIMEHLKPYFEEVLAPKTDEDRERREFFAQMIERARKRWKEEERALKEAEEAKVPPAILAQRKADLEHALRAFEEAKEKFDCEFNVKKKKAKNKKAKSKEAAAKAPSEEASAETTNTEEPAKEMSNTNLIVVQKSKEPSVPTIQTSHAIKASCKLVFNALCHDTSRFFRGVGECFSVHSWLAKRGYRLVKIDSGESSPSNAQKKPEVKQITCESKKAAANEENSSVIVNPAPEASVTEVQTPTVQETQAETAALEPFAEKSSEESKTGASEKPAPVPAEQVDQATTEESTKISREVANPELQQQLVQRLNQSEEKSSIHPEKLADMEMDAEIKRLASLKNKDKSDSLSDKKTSQDGKANSKENATANTWAQFVAQQTKPSSSNAQSKSDKPFDAKNPSVDAASETSPATNAEKPKAKRGRKKIADVQTANATENAATTPNVKQAGKQKVSSEAKPAPAAKPKANTAASTQPKSNAAPSDQNPPKAKRGRKPKALQSANSQVSNDAAKSKEVSVVQAAKVNKAAKTAKSAAQPKDSVKPAEKTAKAATQAKAESKPVLKAPAKTPSSGKSSAKAIQAALTA